MLLFKTLVIHSVIKLPYSIYAQSLQSAVAVYPQLSDFAALLIDNPDLATGLLKASPSDPRTLLIPNNDAFRSYQEVTGDVLSPALDIFEPLLQYQSLSGLYTGKNFSAQAGMTVPTGLTGPTYNNRTAGSALSTGETTAGSRDGQVVFISATDSPTSFTVRQVGSPIAFVQSGLAQQVNLTAVDAKWDGGVFQIVDGFLTLPEVCTKTIRSWGLSYLDSSLNRTKLSSVLDHAFNVTCLGPSDEAFVAAGNPQTGLNVSELTNALLFHTLPQPLYTNFLVNGQTFKTLNNATVKVTINEKGIYFNDAKLTQANVITNNGLMHVLNKVMSPLDPEAPPESVTSIASSTTPSTGGPLSTTSSNPSATTSTSGQATGSAAVLGFQTPTWRFFELLGFLYGYLAFLVW